MASIAECYELLVNPLRTVARGIQTDVLMLRYEPQVWNNGWEQEEAGAGKDKLWAAEEATRPWHRHHLLHWLVPPHIWPSFEQWDKQ